METKEFLEQFSCCGKKMALRENAQTLLANERSDYAFCSCGHIIHVTDSQVDEEEIESL